MKTTRRDFIIGAGLFGSALALGTGMLHAADSAPALAAADVKPTLKGKLYAFGLGGKRFPGNEHRERKTTSILTTFDLETRTQKQTSLDMGEGHAAMGAGDNRILCVSHHKPLSMMLDKDHKVIASFTAPEGYLYGGHGLVFAERNQFILPMRAARAHTAADTGRFEVYDLTTLKKLDMIDSGGIQPHEVHLIPNNPAELAVTHYGDLTDRKPPLEFNVVDAKLTILDSKTLKPLRHYEQNQFNAMSTHMRVSKDGWAYIVLTQYVNFEKPENLKPGEEAEKIALSEMERIFKQKWDYAIPEIALSEKHLAVGLPFLRVNTQTGERQVIYMGNKNHMRSQSVAYNTAMNTAIGLYYHSDNLVLHTPGKDAEIITNAQLKLHGIRGVAEIPGTTCIAVCGTYNDVSVMDLKTREVIAQFQSSNYDSTHLYHDADMA
jgi:Protein of unknown function (DUF1513)